MAEPKRHMDVPKERVLDSPYRAVQPPESQRFAKVAGNSERLRTTALG